MYSFDKTALPWLSFSLLVIHSGYGIIKFPMSTCGRVQSGSDGEDIHPQVDVRIGPRRAAGLPATEPLRCLDLSQID
jgi:hypothetical protein